MGRDGNKGMARPSGQTPEKKKYFFLFEGANTEPQYFDLIWKYRNTEEIDLKTIIGMENLRKYGPDYNQTDIIELIQMADSYRHFLKTKRCDVNFFVSVVLDPIRYRYWDDEDQYVAIKEEIVDNLKKEVCRDGYISKNNYDSALQKSKIWITKKDPAFRKKVYDIRTELINPLGPIPSILDDDVFYVVHDRDYNKHYFSDEKYESALILANQLDIHLAISTPMFEYWLLLHHDWEDLNRCVINKHSKHMVQNVLDVIEKRRKREEFDEKWRDKAVLSDAQKERLRREQKKVDYDRFKAYKAGFKTAIRCAVKGICDNESLMDDGGTSLGLVFNEMINDKMPKVNRLTTQ